MNKYPVPFVLFDDQCVLCTRFKQAFERSPQRQTLHFVSVHDDQIYHQYPFLEKALCLKEIHLVQENLQVLQGPDVMEYLLKNMPWCQPFLWLIETDKGKKALNYFYQKSDQLREKLKRDCGTCL